MNEWKTLERAFFVPSARRVAPALLGHFLVRRTGSGFAAGMIVETEAYLSDDPACHASRGMTPRNRTMFSFPGASYVYFIYGCHFCFNAVCRPEGVGEAVLIRAVEPVCGEMRMRQNRPVSHARHLTNGPGKVCAALGIDRTLDGVDLCAVESALFIAENPAWRTIRRRQGPIQKAPRVGITKATDLPFRFYLPGSEFISRPHRPISQQSPESGV